MNCYFISRAKVLFSSIRSSRRNKHHDVCIIGGGPSGIFTSLLLSQLQIPHTLVEKRLTPTTHPQAHFINNRTMEILRDWSPNVFNNILKTVPPSNNWRDFAYCYNMTGHTFARTDHFDRSMTSANFWQESPTSKHFYHKIAIISIIIQISHDLQVLFIFHRTVSNAFFAKSCSLRPTLKATASHYSVTPSQTLSEHQTGRIE